MGTTRTTYHIRNTPNFADTEHEVENKRLVILIEDVHRGLTIENAMFLKTLIESWLRQNGIVA